MYELSLVKYQVLRSSARVDGCMPYCRLFFFSAELKNGFDRLEEKLFHLQKQAAFKTEANAGELDAVRTAIMDKEGQWNEVRPLPPPPAPPSPLILYFCFMCHPTMCAVSVNNQKEDGILACSYQDMFTPPRCLSLRMIALMPVYLPLV